MGQEITIQELRHLLDFVGTSVLYIHYLTKIGSFEILIQKTAAILLTREKNQMLLFSVVQEEYNLLIGQFNLKTVYRKQTKFCD